MKYSYLITFLLSFLLVGFAHPSEETTQTDLEIKVDRLQHRVNDLEFTLSKTASDISSLEQALGRNGLAVVLFSFFCAWWAKTSGRSALLWFFLGLLFHVLTAIVLLIKTERST